MGTYSTWILHLHTLKWFTGFYWAECNRWWFKFVPALTDAWSSLPFKFKTTTNLLYYLFSLGHSAHSPILTSARHCYLSSTFSWKRTPWIRSIQLPQPPRKEHLEWNDSSLSPTHLIFLLNKVLNNGALLRTCLNFLSRWQLTSY